MHDLPNAVNEIVMCRKLTLNLAVDTILLAAAWRAPFRSPASFTYTNAITEVPQIISCSIIVGT